MTATDQPAREHKVLRNGTHRVATAEQTLQRITPLLPALGITRLADVTWLDDIGIPVYQAVRPNSRSLSVNQGKGLTHPQAMVSAAMESIESWHSDRVPPGELTATVADMEAVTGFRLAELQLHRRRVLHPWLPLEWTRATRLDGGGDSHVPTGLLRIDLRIGPDWSPPLFDVSSNGLASGNSYQEAVLHGLYEVIERDAMTAAGATPGRRVLRLDTVDGDAAWLLERFAAARVSVEVEVLARRTGLACFRARITSAAFPVVFGGAGCHIDRGVALCRALTEAAQSRATEIAGSRDDITAAGYRRAGDVMSGRAPHPAVAPAGRPAATVAFGDVASLSNDDLGDDLRHTVGRVQACTGRVPLAVDHTRPDVGVPVVHVICPGLHFDRTG